MRSSSRRWGVVATVAVAAVAVPASLAWACVALVGFTINGSASVAPGGVLEVAGSEFARGKPVSIRLDSPTGPELASVASPEPSTMSSKFTLPVPIPADITPGPHLLVATQDHYDMNVGNAAARAAFYVNTSPPVAPAPTDRAGSLTVSSGPSPARFVLIGLGAAAAALLLAAAASAVAARRAAPSAESVPTP